MVQVVLNGQKLGLLPNEMLDTFISQSTMTVVYRSSLLIILDNTK